MLTILTLAQEPPVPTPAPRGVFTLAPIVILIAFAVLILLLVKYKRALAVDILFVALSTGAGFLIGLLWFSPISMGFAVTCAFAGFLIALAIVLGIRVVRGPRK